MLELHKTVQFNSRTIFDIRPGIHLKLDVQVKWIRHEVQVRVDQYSHLKIDGIIKRIIAYVYSSLRLQM